MELPPLTALAFCLAISTGGSQGFNVASPQSDIYVRIGGDAVFTVRPSGAIAGGNWVFNSKTIVSWLETSPSIHSEYRPRVTLSYISGSLVLRSVSQSDNGVYKVTLNGVGGGVQASASIKLQALEPVADVTLRANESSPLEDIDAVVLTCSARGTQLQREWLFHNDPVRENDRVTIASDTLLIAPVKRSDMGWYKCIVSNGLNSESAETFVRVYSSGISLFRPIIKIIVGILVIIAVCFCCGLCAWFIAKKKYRPNPAPRPNNDTGRTSGGDNSVAANVGDEWNPYENLPGIAQGRPYNTLVEDRTYMGLKLEDRSVYNELQRYARRPIDQHVVTSRITS